MTAPERVLFLHGLGGSPEGHWQRWLAPRLRERGVAVAFPDLPDPDAPDPDAWLDGLADSLGDEEGWTVLAHSLGGLLWLRACARADAPLGADRTLLVAPPWRPDIPEVEPFLRHGAGAADVAAASGETLILASDDDPYNPDGAGARFAEPLGLELVTILGGAHLNADAGFGPWPAVEAWALGESPSW
jgi:predicted alpha/beta hydrolase family esterase